MLHVRGCCLCVSRLFRLTCSHCLPPTLPLYCAFTLTHSLLVLTASLAARIAHPPQPICPLAPGIAPSCPTPCPSADTHNPCTHTHHRPALSIPPPHVRPAPVHASSSACAPSFVTRT
ncbi:hypothetical protein FIBSPDRAFT_864797, partial [Athelia psychrophila]